MASRNAKGRMVYWKISYCKQLTRVSLLAKLLFTWLIPNTDNLGRMEGDPVALKGMIFPYEEKISSKNIAEALKELVKEYLIMWYSVGGDWYIQFPKIDKYQILDRNNSRKSDYPEPPQELIDKYNDHFRNVEECIDMYLHVSCEEKRREREIEGEVPIHVSKDSQSGKVQFAENVSMTNADYDKLVGTYGEANTTRMIEKLDNYKGASGKKYKSDYRAILNWVAAEVMKGVKDKPREVVIDE